MQQPGTLGVSTLFAGLLVCAIVQPAVAANVPKYSEQVLYSFGAKSNDGVQPEAGAIAVKGKLYGTTAAGGSFGYGTLFSVALSTGKEKILHSFDDTFEGGAIPQAGLIDVKGTLYSTTTGSYDEFQTLGTVFAYDLHTHAEATVYKFCTVGNCGDGAFATSDLIKVKGVLYGTTLGGGASGLSECNGFGCGTVFSFDPGTGAETVLYSFCGQQNCPDGRWPYGGVTNLNGKLYGTTQQGGAQGMGTVFSIDLTTGAETVLHSFGSAGDGATPLADLIDVQGVLYGTTEAGGNGSNGVIFSIDPDNGTETVVYAFCAQQNCRDGSRPFGALLDADGALYGTAANGGAYNRGTAFAFDPAAGTLTVLHAFGNGADGSEPAGKLTEVNGTLYGTTLAGGTHNAGTVFALIPQ